MTESPQKTDRTNPADLQPAIEDDRAADSRAKLAFVAMFVTGMLLPMISSGLVAVGYDAFSVVAPLALFPLICILWPDRMAPVFSAVVVFWVEFVLGGLMDTPSVLGSLFSKAGPYWQIGPWRMQAHLLAIAAPMLAGWITVALVRLRRRVGTA